MNIIQKDYFFNYEYNLFEEGKDINLLNKESGRQLRIFMKKDGKNNNNNNEGHNYLLTNSYLQIIDTIENEPSSSSSELKFHRIGEKKLYLGPCPNSDLDYKLLNQKEINTIMKFASDEDAEKEEYKEQLDKAKSFGIIIDRYQIEKHLNENDKIEKIKNISYEINKLKKDGKVIYICENELSIEIIVSYLVLYEDFNDKDAIDLCKKELPNININKNLIRNIVKKDKINSYNNQNSHNNYNSYNNYNSLNNLHKENNIKINKQNLIKENEINIHNKIIDIYKNNKFEQDNNVNKFQKNLIKINENELNKKINNLENSLISLILKILFIFY